jgi:hypothetical protein
MLEKPQCSLRGQARSHRLAVNIHLFGWNMIRAAHSKHPLPQKMDGATPEKMPIN